MLLRVIRWFKMCIRDRHNLKYWDRTDYIGFGIGAASLCNHKRYTNISDINNYIKALCVEYADNKESNKECIVENIKNIQETLKNSLEINNNCQDLKENIEVLTLEDEMACLLYTSVYLGKSDDYTDKLFELKQMETKFAGLKGSLYMQDYTKDSSSIIFKKDEYN